MRDVFNANLAIQTSSISVNIALCLYQLVNNIESLSHLCTSVGKLFSCLLQSYYFCVCSDVLNECNVLIRRAIRYGNC